MCNLSFWCLIIAFLFTIRCEPGTESLIAGSGSSNPFESSMSSPESGLTSECQGSSTDQSQSIIISATDPEYEFDSSDNELSDVEINFDQFYNLTTNLPDDGFLLVAAIQTSLSLCGKQAMCGHLTLQFSEYTELDRVYQDLLTWQNERNQVNEQRCCSHCLCTNNCASGNRCCPDASAAVHMSPSYAACSDPVVNSERFDNHEFLTERTGLLLSHFRTVSACPDWVEPNINTKCTGSWNQTSLFDSKVFVSSVDPVMVYKNKYCLFCHNDGYMFNSVCQMYARSRNSPAQLPVLNQPVITESSLFGSKQKLGSQSKLNITCNGSLINSTCSVKWRLSATNCRENLYLLDTTDDMLEKYVFENCIVFNEPPAGMISAYFTCASDENLRMISSCNVTGLWEVYDHMLEEICHQSQESFHHPVVINDTVYSNMYCYICNSPLETSAVPKCPSDTYRRYISPDLGPVYDLLVDPTEARPIESYTPSEKDQTCLETQVYDVYFGKCRRYFCPYHSRPSYYNCFTQRFTAQKLVYELQILLEFKTNPHITVNSQAEATAITKVVELLNIESCEIFDTSFMSYWRRDTDYVNHHVGYVVTLRISWRENVCIDRIIKSVRLEDFLLELYTETVKFTLRYFDSSSITGFSLINRNHFTQIVTDFQTNLLDHALVPLPKLDCQFVILHATEIFELSKNVPLNENKTLDKLFIPVHMHGWEYYHICWSDYLDIGPVGPAQERDIFQTVFNGNQSHENGGPQRCTNMLIIVVCLITVFLSNFIARSIFRFKKV